MVVELNRKVVDAMTRTPVWPVRHGKTDEGDGFLAPALYVSIAIAIFAVITQGLVSAGVVGLDAAQMATIWLWVGGLIVLLWIAYIISRAYVTAKRPKEAEIELLKARAEQAEAEAEQALAEARKAERRVEEALKGVAETPNGDGIPRIDGSAGKDKDGWVPPGKLRHLVGRESSVITDEVFPEGCYLEPDSIKLVADKPTGQHVYECRVVDRNQALKHRPHETMVDILASQKPSEPSIPFGLVEFEGLTITPYVTDRDPMWIRYSLRATGIHPAAAATGRVPATWSAPVP